MQRTLRRWTVTLTLALAGIGAEAVSDPFALRGYYMTFMRMPTFGLREWQEMIDCIRADGGNTLLLWTAGAFRSRKFPITWEYNRDHKNVQQDFVGDLIDYAHERGIKVLLCFTPFAYDGVNQYAIAQPELKATQRNGGPAQLWGMHSWGYNLCPSKTAAQRFMLDYVREMIFGFYANADGLMIESSDYAICHCVACRDKFFDKEFEFIRQISTEVWEKKPDATVVVYPRYFSGRKVPGFDMPGATQSFDPRWTLFFTPHSAHIDTNLLHLAKTSMLWNEGLTLRTPATIREGARTARRYGLTGYVPSLEPFSCVDGPPRSAKPRLKPFHFEWLGDGQMPLNELLVRVNRIAYREFTRNPDLSQTGFKKVLGREIFGDLAQEQSVTDLLYVQESFFLESDWFRPSPLLEPQRLRDQAEKERWPSGRLRSYMQRIERLREIARSYQNSKDDSGRELHRIATFIAAKWADH